MAIGLADRYCSLASRIRVFMSTRPPRFSLGLAARAVALVVATIPLAACNDSKNAYVAPPPPKVQVAQPLQKPVTEYLELTGNTQAFATVDLVARVQGFLTSINYVDGATVKKGAQLFGIERDIYQAQVNQQEATLASDQATEEYNKAEYGRQRRSPDRISPARRRRRTESPSGTSRQPTS